MPASAASRLRRARPSNPYLNETVSPCSVSFMRPGGCAAGCEAIAAWVGPPPRPALPPRPWKIVSADPMAACHLGELLLRAIDRPLRGEVAAVLARVGVTDHHLRGRVAATQQLVDDRRVRRREVVERLEERHDRERLVGQRAGGDHVCGARRAGDDQRVERLRPVLAPAGDRGRDRFLGAGLAEVARVQPQVELRHVEAEDLDHALEAGDAAVRDAASAVRRAGWRESCETSSSSSGGRLVAVVARAATT